MIYQENQIDLNDWYRRYGEAVYRRLLRYTHNPDQAMDLMQETFLRTHKYRRSYRGDAKPISWLFTIADRCFFSSIETKKTSFDKTDELERFLREEETASDQIFEQHDLVLRLLNRAPKDVKAILIHRFFDEMELADIAEKLDINEKTVRRKLKRFYSNARKFAAKNRH